MKRLFPGGYPNSYEIIEHLQDRLQKELNRFQKLAFGSYYETCEPIFLMKRTSN